MGRGGGEKRKELKLKKRGKKKRKEKKERKRREFTGIIIIGISSVFYILGDDFLKYVCVCVISIMYVKGF